MYSLSTPRGYERPLVADIKTPAVRTLSEAELQHRHSSIAFFRSSSGMDGLSQAPSRGPSRGTSLVAALVAELGPEPALTADLQGAGCVADQPMHMAHA